MSRFTLIHRILLLAGMGALLGGLCRAEETTGKALLYSLEGVLDAERVERLKREIKNRLDMESDIRTLIIEIDSKGTRDGQLGPAADAAEFLRALKDIRLVAWVNQDGFACNASALIALCARDIVMGPGARLGFYPNDPNDEAGERVEVKDTTPEDARNAWEVIENHIYRRTKPEGWTHLARAMFSKHHSTIFKVSFEKIAGVDKIPSFRFLDQEELASLTDKERMAKVSERSVVPEGQRFHLDLETARGYGLVTSVVGDVNAVIATLHLNVAPSDVVGPGGALLQPRQLPGPLVFLNHPVVRFFLLLLGILGILIEFHMPGTLIPSLSGLLFLAIFFFAGFHYDTANLYEILLFVLGLLLIAIELILMPGVLILGLSGAAACIIAVVLAMIPSADSAADMTYGRAASALTTLILSAGSSCVVFMFILRYLPQSRFFDRSGIVMHAAIQGTSRADSAIEAQSRAAVWIGRTALAVTSLRPSGTVEVDGKRLDVVASGDFVEKGEKVQIIGSDGTRTVVKRI